MSLRYYIRSLGEEVVKGIALDTAMHTGFALVGRACGATSLRVPARRFDYDHAIPRLVHNEDLRFPFQSARPETPSTLRLTAYRAEHIPSHEVKGYSEYTDFAVPPNRNAFALELKVGDRPIDTCKLDFRRMEEGWKVRGMEDRVDDHLLFHPLEVDAEGNRILNQNKNVISGTWQDKPFKIRINEKIQSKPKNEVLRASTHISEDQYGYGLF